MDRKWLKLHSFGWLNGTVRHSLEASERSTFIDLLCMGNQPPRLGYIERHENIPYELPWLAEFLAVPLEVLCSTIFKCVVQERIEIEETGVMKIMNWDYYQGANGSGRLEGRELELHQRKQLQRLMATYEGDVMDHVISNFRFINQDTGEIMPYVPLKGNEIDYRGKARSAGGPKINVIEPTDSTEDRQFIDTKTGKVIHPERTRKKRVEKKVSK